MQGQMHTLAVVPNLQKDIGLRVTQDALAVLADAPVTLRLPLSCRRMLSDLCQGNVNFTSDDELYKNADCAIVLGGDGSVIKAASKCARRGIPLLGINLGRIGYLAEVEQNELYLLSRLCRGEYRIERRMMLSVTVMRKGREIHKMQPALNEAVISNGAISHMVDLSLACDGNYVSNFHADGVIVATPTGSTAYSMSAGGPVIDPALDCLCVTPVCAHSLSARPMLLSSQSTLTLENICCREDNTYLTVDGDENFKLLLGDVVSVCRAEVETKMIRFHANSFYSVLNRKMGI
ncbi:MAG: NAD(+)/NADH kinase [Clostridia bacterium]|nr:NAD(+)/NADH kinase [Clostridia bacterium]